MQPPEGVEDHDTEDSTADVTQSPEMTASIAGHSGRLSDLEDVRNSSHCIIGCQQEVSILNVYNFCMLSIVLGRIPIQQVAQGLDKQLYITEQCCTLAEAITVLTAA